MSDNWTLELTLRGPMGEKLSYALPLDDLTAREVSTIEPPPMIGAAPLLSPNSLADVVGVMRRREFRKDLFIREAALMGQLLAERMEDAEGWHGIERQEPAAQRLRGR